MGDKKHIIQSTTLQPPIFKAISSEEVASFT